MKKQLLFYFGMIACWIISFEAYGQVPEFLYYKFEDSTHIINHASNPQGDQNIPIPPNLFTDTLGFNGSYALSGTGDSAQGGIKTGFYPDYSRSFTISFWYQDTTQVSGMDMVPRYFFGDSLADFHCYGGLVAYGDAAMLQIAVSGGLLKDPMFGMAPTDEPVLIQLVYNATPITTMGDGTYGTYTLYLNGMPGMMGVLPITEKPSSLSSGLIIGSTPGIPPKDVFPGFDFSIDMAGFIDEFRWYNRALTPIELQDTVMEDLLPLGICPLYSNFVIDSISAESVKISWVPGAGNDAFFLEYGPAGFSRGAGTVISGNYPGSQPPVILNNLTAETEYDVYFGEYCNGGVDSVYNPNPQVFKTTPLCPTPMYFEFLTTTRDSIEFTWEHDGSIQEFYVIYGPQYFDTATSGIKDTIVSLPYKVGGLNPETIYDFYISTGCGGSYGNSITIKRSMGTECGIKTAPFFEDFEGDTWGEKPITVRTGLDTIDPCWDRVNANIGDFVWEVVKLSRGGRIDNRFLLTDESTIRDYGDEAIIYTPYFDISSLAEPYLSFYYYRMFSHGMGTVKPFLRVQPDFYVEVNDGNGWQTVKEITGYEQLNEASGTPADPFKKCGLHLDSFGDTIQIRFRGVRNKERGGEPGQTAIDDISIAEAPECPDVFKVGLLNIRQDTSILIDIESSAPSLSLEWGPRGFEQGTGCSGTFFGSYTLDSCITVNQDMDLFIRDCSNGSWSGPYAFCGSRTAPYFTDFDEEAITNFDYSILRNVPCWDLYTSGKQSQGDIAKIFPDSHDWNLGVDGKRNNKLQLHNYTATLGDTFIAIPPAFIDLSQGNKQLRFKVMLMEGNSHLSGNMLIVGTMTDPKAGNTFKAVDTIYLTYNQWKEYSIKLDVGSGYNGTDLYVGLKLGEGIKTCLIDDFNYEEIPTCPAPSSMSLEAKDLWMDAVTIQWQSPNEVPTILRYGEEGFDPEGNNYTQTTALTDTFHRVTGLTPATTYDLYIRDSCGDNDYSRWIGPVTFTTLCSPFTAPYLEDFDGSTWYPAPPIHPYAVGMFGGPVDNFGNMGDTLDICWRRNVRSETFRHPYFLDSVRETSRQIAYLEYYHTWGITQDFAGHNDENGPASDYSGNGNYAVSMLRRAVTDVGKEEGIGDLYSPLIDMSSLDHPYLTFYYHRYGEHRMPDFWVEVNDGNGWDTVKYYSGPEPTQISATSPYYQAGVDLSGFSDTIQMRFRSLHQYSAPHQPRGLTAIDNIEIKEAPPCIKPEGLTEDHYINASSGSWRTILKWNPSASLTDGFEVLIGPPGFDPGSIAAQGLGIYVEGTDSLVLDTLQDAGCYEFVVRSICASGDTSDYSNAYSFCLPCIQQAPLTENFDVFTLERFDPQDLPSSHLGHYYFPCWYFEIDIDAVDEWGYFNYLWTEGDDLSSFFGGASMDADDCEVGKFLYTKGSGYVEHAGDSTLLYSPVVDIRDMAQPELSFAYHMFGLDIDALYMDIHDGESWHRNVVSLIGRQQNAGNMDWKDTIISLIPYNATGFVRARFRATRLAGNDNNIAIDNFRISDPVSCPAPTCFFVRDTTDSTVTLVWQTPAEAMNVEVEYGPRDYKYGQGTKVNTAADSLVVEVEVNRLYDAYIRSICSGGDSSFVVGPVPFQSLFSPCDDFEAYAEGSLTNQSGLFYSYTAINDRDIPGVGFEYRGDEEITNLDANSGSQSLRLHEGGPEGGASAIAWFDPISSDFDEATRNIYTVDFSFSVNDTGGGYYDFIPGVRKNFSDRAKYNPGELGFRFNQTSMLWEAFNRNDPSDVKYSFKYKPGWNDLRHVIDLDNDSVWMVLNDVDMQVGWKYSTGNGGNITFHLCCGHERQLEGVHFLTTPHNLNTTTSASEFYIDDFCVSPYECPKPSDLLVEESSCTYAEVSWLQGVQGAKTIIEYGISGFVKGSGDTLTTRAGKYEFEGLTPGESYDVYISEVCGFDTVFTGPVSFTLPTEATADFTYTLGDPTYNNLEVTFDASGSVGANAYIWDFGDFKTGSGETTSHVYIRNRTYTVSLIIESDCGNDTITKTIDISGIGLEENILSQSLEVYPNPFTDKVQITFDTQSSEDAVLRLTDPSGKVILQKRASNINGSYSGEMNLGHLAKGTYMLRIECGEVSAVKRIIRN